MNHCRNLQFEEKPDYRHLLSLLEDLGRKNKFDLEDRVYDWVEKENLIGFNVLSFGGNKRRRVQQKGVGELSFMFQGATDVNKYLREQRVLEKGGEEEMKRRRVEEFAVERRQF